MNTDHNYEPDGHADHDHDHDHDHEPDGHGHEHEHQTGLRGFLLQTFRPHSHDAADSVDAALESSAQGIRAVKISLVGLGATAFVQLGVVLLTGSVALLADTIHNFSDALTAFPLWIAFVLGRRAASRRYTYGYGRAEDLAGVFIVAMIVLSAVLAGYESVTRLVNPQPLTHVWVVMLAGLVGAAGNELVALYRIRVGREIGSAALIADGLHARTDGLTSLAVVLGAAGVMAGFPMADPVVGLAITVAILFVLKGAARDIYRRLMDAVDPELYDRAHATLGGCAGVVGIDSLQIRWIGHKLHAEASIVVDDSLSLVQAHDLANDAHHELLHDIAKLVDVTVHVSPQTSGGMDHHARLAHHRPGPPAPASEDSH